TLSALRMERDQVPALVAPPKAASHGLDDLALFIALDGTITAHDPDEAGIAIASAEPQAVGFGRRGSEDLRPDAPFLVPFVAPGRQQADHEAPGVGFGDDVVDVVPVVVRGAVDDARACGVEILQG